MTYCKIEVGDCIDKLSALPDACADMTFADPPFNLDKNYDKYEDNRDEEEYLEFCHAWIDEMVRITKPTGSIFLHNIPKWLIQYSCILHDADVIFKNWIAWDALSGQMRGTLRPNHYGILYYARSKEAKKFKLRSPHRRCRYKECSTILKDFGGKKENIPPFGSLISDVWRDIHRLRHSKYKNDHPCQLPVLLMERLILLCTEENDLVIDPFVGAGGTAIAAKRLGRNFWGCDISTQYVDTSLDNVARQINVCKFDDTWASCYTYPVPQFITVKDVDLKNENFKKLFVNWPQTPDERKSMDSTTLNLRNDMKDHVKVLNHQLAS